MRGRGGGMKVSEGSKKSISRTETNRALYPALLPSLSVLTRRIISAKGKRGEIRKADDSTEAVSGFHRSDVQKERKSNLYSAPVMASP